MERLRYSTRAAAQLPVVLAEGVDGLPRAAGDEVVHHALMLPGQRAELRRQGEGHHEVIAGHPLLQLLVYPVLHARPYQFRDDIVATEEPQTKHRFQA